MCAEALLVVAVLAQTGVVSDPPPCERVLRAPWSEECFAKEDDGARLGPAALAVAGANVYVLDRVHGRVQVLDRRGAIVRTVMLGTATVDMLAVDTHGTVVALDAFVAREIVVAREARDVERIALPDHGWSMPTGIFVDTGAALVEWDHAWTTRHAVPGLEPRFARAKGPADLAGRPAPFGAIRASRDRDAVRLQLHRGPREREDVTLPAPGIECILELQSNRAAQILVAWFVLDDPRRELRVAILDSRGRVLARFALADGSVTDLYTRLWLDDDGGLWQLRTDERGVEILRWAWEEVRR